MTTPVQKMMAAITSRGLVLDGAMGTLLQTRGLKLGVPADLWNIEKPEKVLNIHQSYLSAGAQIIFTNTFMGIDPNCTKEGVRLAKQARLRQASLHQAANNHDVWVAGSLGPAGVGAEQIKILLREGIDLLVLETLTDAEKIRTALDLAKKNVAGKIPILVMMSLAKDGNLGGGTNPLDLIADLEKMEKCMIGYNCSYGPEHLWEPFLKLKQKTRLPIAIKPNAGLPVQKNGQWAYTMSPDEFASWGKKFREAGAKLVGGCCGTTPEAIKKLSTKIESNR